MKLTIAVLVVCQNGHEAKWIFEIDGLDVTERGVQDKDKCDCPKWNFGEGYRACGDPVVVRIK